MKQLSEKTVGGRIRKVRTDQGLTLKELAEVAGITSNHLSLVERGVKPASQPLLRKIAEATNVSRDWLRNGDNDTPDTPPATAPIWDSKNNYSANHSFLPDIRLFLTLVLMEVPTINSDSLAVMLNTMPDTINAILAGQTIDIFEMEEMKYFFVKVFSQLAEQLDIDTVCHKLDTLSDYLKKEQLDAQRVRNAKLFQALKKYVEQMTKLEVRLDGQINTVEKPFPYVQMCFQNSGYCWDFRYFQSKFFSLDDKYQAEDGYSEEYEDEIMELVKSQMSNVGHNKVLAIVFDKKDLYEDFADRAQVYTAEANTLADEDPTGSGSGYGFGATAILVDPDTFAVLDEKRLLACTPVEWN